MMITSNAIVMLMVRLASFSSYEKCTATIRMLAYGVDGDLVDEYMHMSEPRCLRAMYKL